MAITIEYIESLYHAGTAVTKYIPLKRSVNHFISQHEAKQFLEECNHEDSGFLEPNTMFNKAARDAMLTCVKTFSKAVILAMYVEIYNQYDTIMRGSKGNRGGRNINEVAIETIKLLTDESSKTYPFLLRSSNSYLFYFLETYFSKPKTTPVDVTFFKWLEDQPLNTLCEFLHKHKDVILSKGIHACDYIREEFDSYDSNAFKWAYFDIINGTNNGVKTPTEIPYKIADYTNEDDIRTRLGEDVYNELVENLNKVHVRSTTPGLLFVDIAKVTTRSNENSPMTEDTHIDDMPSTERLNENVDNLVQSPRQPVLGTTPPKIWMPMYMPPQLPLNFQLTLNCSCVEEAQEILTFAARIKERFRMQPHF
jgi:hypothetical protein